MPSVWRLEHVQYVTSLKTYFRPRLIAVASRILKSLLLRVRRDITTLSHFYECCAFLPVWALFTSTTFSYHFEPFLPIPLELILTVLSHFFECGAFLPLWAIFMSATRFYHVEPLLRVRLILTIFIQLYESDAFFPFGAIFTSASHHFESFLRERRVFIIWAYLRVRRVFCHSESFSRAQRA